MPAVAVVLGLAGLLSVAYAVAGWAVLLALLLWRLIAGAGLGIGVSPTGQLSIQAENLWVFEQNGIGRTLTLVHVWYGPVWTTLRFDESGTQLELTVWRGTVSSTGWRHLRQLASRDPLGPRLRITEVQ